MSPIPLFPEQGSTLAPEVDALYFFLVALTAFFSLLIAGLIVFFAVRYRRISEDDRPEPIAGSIKLELIWTAIPLGITLVLFYWGASVYFKLYRPPAGATEVYVVGKQWMWKFEHLDGQREINELHVPVGRPVRLTLASEDVIHSFYVPAFRTKTDVVPGRFSTNWFQAAKPGRYRIFCAEYCGTRHSGMIGWVVAMDAVEYQTWLAGGAATGSLADAGAKLFQDLACHTCHRPDSLARGPNLEGLYGKTVRFADGGTAVADESYLREAIVAPRAHLVEGFQPIMPTYQGLVSEEGLLQLVAYIRSLSGAKPAPERPAPLAAPSIPQGEIRR